MEMGMPFTPKSPKPRIREPNTRMAVNTVFQFHRPRRTISHHGNTGLIYTRPIPENLSNLALVLYRDILDNGAEI